MQACNDERVTPMGNYVEGTPQQWQAVAQAVLRRRQQLGLTRDEAAARASGSIHTRTWAHIEAADKSRYLSSKILTVCTVLGWSHDSIDRIMTGQSPVHIEGIEATEDQFRLATLERELRELRHLSTAQQSDLEAIRDQLALLRSEIVSALGRRKR